MVTGGTRGVLYLADLLLLPYVVTFLLPISYSLSPTPYVPTHYVPTHYAPTPYIPHQAQPLLAHDLTELRRLSLLELAATHGDPAEAVP